MSLLAIFAIRLVLCLALSHTVGLCVLCVLCVRLLTLCPLLSVQLEHSALLLGSISSMLIEPSKLLAKFLQALLYEPPHFKFLWPSSSSSSALPAAER